MDEVALDEACLHVIAGVSNYEEERKLAEALDVEWDEADRMQEQVRIAACHRIAHQIRLLREGVWLSHQRTRHLAGGEYGS